MVTVAPRTRLDFKRTDPYRATSSPRMVDVAPTAFLTVDGEGAPATGGFQQAVETLYPVAYALKFALKGAGRRDWVVAPLEALWWSAKGELRSTKAHPERLRWRAMLAQPAEVRAEDVERAVEAASRRHALPSIGSIRFDVYDEGMSAQVLHVGPYSAEDETIVRLLDYIAEQRRVPRLLHHEIYLSDPNRTAPERLRTIIRQPVG
jgi:hypothetical protein